MSDIPNIDIDFNSSPEIRGLPIPDYLVGKVKVGDKLRLVDLDATAGFLVVEVKGLNEHWGEKSTPYVTATVESKPGGYTSWESTL